MAFPVQLNVGAAMPVASAATISGKLFGVVVKSADTDSGRSLVAGSNIDKALEFLGAASIRYPGGTESRTDFSITSADDIAGLHRALDYCAANGLTMNFTVDDTIYVNSTTGQASMTAQQRADLQSFLRDDLIGYANARGVTIESIKIGNEFTGRTADYGSPAVVGYGNVAALLVNEMDAMLNGIAPGAGYVRPALVVESGGWQDGAKSIMAILAEAGAATKVGGIDLHGTQNGTQGTPTLDLTWDLYFGTAASDEPGVTYDQRLSRISDLWQTNAATANVELRVDAWCFPTTSEGPALTNAALAMLQIHSFSLGGITSATNYLGYGPDLSGLVRRVNGNGTFDLAVQTTAGGAMFAMMESALRGTGAIKLAGAPLPAYESTAATMIRAFAGDQKLVLYTVNRTADDQAIDLVTSGLTSTLEAFIGGVKTASTQILGVTDPNMVALRQGQAQIESGSLTLAQLGAGGTDFTLNAYETGQIILMASGTFGTGAANVMTGTTGGNTLHGLGGDDVLNGLAGNDKLAGGTGADQIFGGDGNDMLYGGAGADTLDGGLGTDMASYTFATSAIVANLASPTGNTGDASGDRYTSIENLQGGRFNDSLTGDTGANRLEGGAGNDNLGGAEGNDLLYGETGNDWLRGNQGDDTQYGGPGNDTLAGGAGADLLSGGTGNDDFVYYSKTDGGDSIADFSATAGTNDDRFSISAAGFGGGLTKGTLSAAQFVVRDADNLAQDSDDRFIFRVSDGTVWFDADGNGAGNAVLIADLQNNVSTLTAADFWLF
jgi:Ca2+-binding RTX toxin-like protein